MTTLKLNEKEDFHKDKQIKYTLKGQSCKVN